MHTSQHSFASTPTFAGPWQFTRVAVPAGPRLHVATLGAQGAPPLLLLHGFTDSWQSFSRVAEALATRHRLIVLDHRGHGDSDRPAHGYHLDNFASDVLAVLDAFELAQVGLVGHSLGTSVALAAAIAAPTRFSRLALIGAASTWDRPEIHEFAAAVTDLPDPVPEDFVRAFQTSTTHAPVPEVFLSEVVRRSMQVPARVWREVIANLVTVTLSADLARITMPTQLLWGEYDGFAPRTTQDELLAKLPHARLHCYANTGHAPHWECPEAVQRDLLATFAN